MISVEDCIAFSGLSEDEVAAIGEHEHISPTSRSRIPPHSRVTSNDALILPHCANPPSMRFSGGTGKADSKR